MSESQSLIKFEKIVIDKFSFLENLKFKRMPLQKNDFEYPQDRNVEINYFSDILCVSVRWHLIYASLEVGLIELKNGKLPKKYSLYGDKGYARGIGLSSLVEFITKKQVFPLLSSKKLGEDSIKKITENWIVRGNLINNEFELLIAQYARMLEKYGMEIINGDFSIFSKVQDYSKSKL